MSKFMRTLNIFELLDILEKKKNQIERLIEVMAKESDEVVKNLINEMDDELNKNNFICYNAIQFAAINNREEIFRLLLNKVNDEALNDCSNFNGTALYLGIEWCLLNDDNIELSQALVDRMTPEAINSQERRFGYTALHNAVYKRYPKMCKFLIKASPTIINIKTSVKKETALDISLTFDNTSDIPKLLIKYGANFSDDNKIINNYRDWFKPICKAVKIIDQIFEKQEINFKVKIHEDLYPTLLSRFKFKMKEKFGHLISDKDYKECKSYMQKIESMLPLNLYKDIIKIINLWEIHTMKLEDLEARLIHSLESTREYPFCPAPFKALKEAHKYNYLVFELEQNTLDFYGANLKFTKVGTYLTQLLNNEETTLQKLENKPQGWEFLQLIKEEISLPKELSANLNNLLDKVVFVDEVKIEEKIAPENIQAETIEKSFIENLFESFTGFIYKYFLAGQASDFNDSDLV